MEGREEGMRYEGAEGRKGPGGSRAPPPPRYAPAGPGRKGGPLRLLGTATGGLCVNKRKGALRKWRDSDRVTVSVEMSECERLSSLSTLRRRWSR